MITSLGEYMITVSMRKQTDKNGDSFFDRSPANAPDMVNWRVMVHHRTWRPATDVFEMEDQIVVRIEIAGMREEDFTISVDRNSLIIQGVREDTKERRAFHQMEIRYGEFSTEVDLPLPIDIEKVHAEYRDGFLTVVMPKALPKHIPINKA